MKRKILLVAGARPNFMKIAPIYRELKKYPDAFSPTIVHTGQHYDKNMSDNFFRDLEIPEPDVYLGSGSGTHAEQTGRVMVGIEKVCMNEKPDWIVVVGDVNSTMASAIAASKLCIPVAHVEAGLRSGDKTMPEEINRIVTDAISNLLLTPSKDADENLLKEGHPRDRIHRVGNVMIDSLEFIKSKVLLADSYRQLSLEPQGYALMTLHRPSNVDNPELLKQIFDKIILFSENLKIIFPVHPRTKLTLGKNGILTHEKYKNIRFVDPLGYLDFINVMMHSKFVITDSGGIQEETTYLGIPCLTLRNTTERPVTITEGTNELVSIDTIDFFINKIQQGLWKKGQMIEFWDGKASARIAEQLS